MTRVVNFQQSHVVAGVARCDITPQVGIYHRMWGAATHDISTGVHRRLNATVLGLAPRAGSLDETYQSYQWAIAVDHCLLWTSEMQTMLKRISELAKVSVESITLFFSHTHGAGLMGLERTDLPGGELIGPYLDELASKIASLIITARETAVSATITYGVGRCSLAKNRDYWDDVSGRSVCGFNPEGTADDQLVLGRISDATGKTIATIVNYACHPTTLAWQNTLISPDYIGSMREVIELATEAPCLFIQGASGDVGPREGFVGDVAVADRNGRQLGYAALSTLEDLPPPDMQFVYAGPVVSGATIGTWKHEPISEESNRSASQWQSKICTVDLPLRSDLPRRDELVAERDKWQLEYESALAAGDVVAARDARAMAERATRQLIRVAHLPDEPTIPYNAKIWRMGDAFWISLNGEHYNCLQTQLRKRFPNHTLIIGTLANGSDVWYLPDRESFGKGLYQEDASILCQGSLESLIDALGATMIRMVANPGEHA